MDLLAAFWSQDILIANGVICLNLLGALGVGVLVGYERSYHGRAAGMRTYALVCMAATAMTVVCGFPDQWYGGRFHGSEVPTQVIQGIVTGIGFLGAGVIMKEGFSIHGLSTSAAIWTVAAIGVTIGLGFYVAAIVATLLTILVMSAFKRLEMALPHLQNMHLTLVFDRATAMTVEELYAEMSRQGVAVRDVACQTILEGTRFQYDLQLQAMGPQSFNSLVGDLTRTERILTFRLSPERE